MSRIELHDRHGRTDGRTEPLAAHLVDMLCIRSDPSQITSYYISSSHTRPIRVKEPSQRGEALNLGILPANPADLKLLGLLVSLEKALSS